MDISTLHSNEFSSNLIWWLVARAHAILMEKESKLRNRTTSKLLLPSINSFFMKYKRKYCFANAYKTPFWIITSICPQNYHRTVRRDLERSSPTPPAKAGFLQQVAQVVIKTGLEYLHRQRLHNFSEQSKSATVRDFIATSLGFPISLGNFEVLIVGILKIMLMQISLVLLLIWIEKCDVSQILYGRRFSSVLGFLWLTSQNFYFQYSGIKIEGFQYD